MHGKVLMPMADETVRKQQSDEALLQTHKVKFEVYGEEMMEKLVKACGNSGRVYLPPDWIDHTVKIIKVE
jgi:putative transposon-encoded protein